MWDLTIYPLGGQHSRWHTTWCLALQLIWDLTIHSLGGQRPRWHTTWCLVLQPMWDLTIHPLRGPASSLAHHPMFGSPTDVVSHNPPPLAAQRPRWHTPDIWLCTICNSSSSPLADVVRSWGRIVRSHIGWSGEQRITYKGMENSL